MVEKLLHYNITKKLGEGKHGRVYLAWDTGLDRVVAIKYLRAPLIPDEKCERFLADMRLLSRLNDTHIGTFYSLELVDGTQYIIREYVEGDTIEELVRGRPLGYSRFLALACQLAQTLQRAHDRGVLHSNITPRNVFVTPDGQAKLMDFGLPFAENPEAVSAANPGDLVYLAPERLGGGRADERADFYALGVVFYQMLTGRLPFATDGHPAFRAAILDGQSDFVHQEVQALPAEVRLLLKKLLATNPDDRFAGAHGLAVTLGEMLSFQREERHRAAEVVPAGRARQYLLLALLMALLLIFWFVITTLYK